MLIEVTVPYLASIGKLGTRVEMPDAEARVLILLKQAREADVEHPRATRRVYRRRDMTAEGTTPPTVETRAPLPASATLRTRRPRRVTTAPVADKSQE